MADLVEYGDNLFNHFQHFCYGKREFKTVEYNKQIHHFVPELSSRARFW